MDLINRRIGWNSKWSEKGVGYREEGREFNFYYVTVGRALHDRSTRGKSPPLSLPPSQNFNRSRVLKAIRECFQACYKSITIHDGGRGREGKRLVRHTNNIYLAYQCHTLLSLKRNAEFQFPCQDSSVSRARMKRQ